MARSYLHFGRFGRGNRSGLPASSALAGNWIFAGTFAIAGPVHPSVDRWWTGSGSGHPRWGTLDHQSARRDRCPSVCLPGAFCCLGGNSHVVRLRCRDPRRGSPSAKAAAADLAPLSHRFRCGGCRWKRDTCHVDRRDNGACVKGGTLRAGHCSNR